ncbi:hypothetical protein QBE79_27790, partial [Klebsiella pneumoniae]|nr:hypothetical protein [Klebsiella pneumoniae]MDG5868007.1 hypothetical protein [Klebsiella pneumoniae]
FSPWLPEFKSHYPDVDLVLDLTEQLEIPSIERLDAAVRIGKLKNSSLYATKKRTRPGLPVQALVILSNMGFPVDRLNSPATIFWTNIMIHTPFHGVVLSTLREESIAYICVAMISKLC